jgi:hypothetical protein
MSGKSRLSFSMFSQGKAMLAIAVAASACAGPSAARTGGVALADPALSLLESLRAASAPTPSLAGSAIRGEEVACFLEDRAASGAPIDRSTFDAWRRSQGSEPALGTAKEALGDRTIARLQARLERTLLERGARIPAHRIAFGTVRTGRASPSAFAVPGADARLVVLDDRLFDMVYAVVSAAFDAGPYQGGSACLARTPAALNDDSTVLARPRFSVTLRHFAGVAASGRYDVAPAQATSILALVRVAELFALGHEYAHVLLGHGASATAGTLATAGGAPTVELSYATDQELAADALAFRIVQETIARDGTDAEKAMAPFGPDVMLHVIDLLETARAVFDGRALPTAPTSLPPRLWPPGSGASDAFGDSLAAGEPPLTVRRVAMRQQVHAVATGSSASSPDAAAFVGQTTACLFGSVSPGLASAGERRRALQGATASAALTQRAQTP